MNKRWIGLALVLALGCSVDAPSDAGLDAAQLEDAGEPTPDAGHDAGPAPSPRERCDEPGEVCCADGQCGNGLPCVEGLCGSNGCGELGEPCCGTAGGPGFCHILSGAECDQGTCVEPGCGFDGYECCAEGPECKEDFVCHEGSCLRCGDVGESCCPGAECDGDYYCQPEPGSLGRCLLEAPPCGGEGELCCIEGPSCGDGLGCVLEPYAFHGTCLPGPTCGSDGRPCCESDPACGAGSICVDGPDGDRCRRCGGFDQLCCAGALCGPGLVCDASTCVLPPP